MWEIKRQYLGAWCLGKSGLLYIVKMVLGSLSIEGDGNGKRQLFCRGGYEVGPFNVLAKVASKFCASLPSALRT